MTVIRVEHQKNYVVINKIALEDRNLSFKAKGLWAYCMSRPDNWEFHVSHLATVSKEGEDAIYSAIKELIEFGYCIKKQENSGKFGKLEYTIFETPQIQIILPQPGFPVAGGSHAGDPELTSIECIPSIEKETVCPSASSQGQKMKIKNLRKEEIEISIDDAFRFAISEKKNWTTQEIQKAWNILFSKDEPINDWKRYFEKIIENLISKSKFDGMKKNKKNEEPKECLDAQVMIIDPRTRSEVGSSLQRLLAADSLKR